MHKCCVSHAEEGAGELGLGTQIKEFYASVRLRPHRQL